MLTINYLHLGRLRRGPEGPEEGDGGHCPAHHRQAVPGTGRRSPRRRGGGGL